MNAITNRLKMIARALEWRLLHRTLLLLGKVVFWFTGRQEQRGPIDLTKVTSVLVTRLDEIGDAVLTSPFLRELRRNAPSASITLLVKPAIANLVELCPYVDEVVTYEPRGLRYFRSFQATWRALRLTSSRLWKRNYDLAMAPRWDTDLSFASMVSYLSGAKQRVAYSEKATDDKSHSNVGLDQLFTHVFNVRLPKHEAERSLDLIRFLGGNISQDELEVWISKDDEAYAEKFLEQHGIHSNALVLALGPEANHPKRRWPVANFADLSEWFQQDHDGFVVVFGTDTENTSGEGDKRLAGARVVNAAGQTTLRQALALLKRCRLFVGNDAGPMHLAAAVGLPVVEISCHPLGGSSLHANSPERFGPWSVPGLILRPAPALASCSDACNSERAHCIMGISVEEAKKAINNLLESSAHQRRDSLVVTEASSHPQAARPRNS